jgi:hypothetical protein
VTQICLYLDEDALQDALVQALRNAEVDVVTVAEVNRFSSTDEEQLIWATQQGRTIYSFNVGDFHYLHRLFLAQGRNHSGIILAPQQRYTIGEQCRGLLKLLKERSSEEIANQLVFLSAYLRL